MPILKKISDLPFGVVSDDDSFPLLDGGGTKRVLASAMAAYVLASDPYGPFATIDGGGADPYATFGAIDGGGA